jgi:hypothetical protein
VSAASGGGRIVVAGALVAALGFFVMQLRTKPITLAEGPAPSTDPSGNAAPIASAAEPAPTVTKATATLATLPSAHPQRQVRELAVMKWGAGPKQLGRTSPKEGNPEAPMSLVATREGGAVILDQVNKRLVRIGKDGSFGAPTPIALRQPQDLAISRDGIVAVLDRLSDKRVDLVASDGKVRGSLPIEGKGISEGRTVTGVFIDGFDVYVERTHGPAVRIGDLGGNADTLRPELSGRPSRDGASVLNAWVEKFPDSFAFVSRWARVAHEPVFTRQVDVAMESHGIALFDSDAMGALYLAVIGNTNAPNGELTGVMRVLCLAANSGDVIGVADLPGNASLDETFREIVAVDGGGVLYLSRTDAGARLLFADCRSPAT